MSDLGKLILQRLDEDPDGWAPNGEGWKYKGRLEVGASIF